MWPDKRTAIVVIHGIGQQNTFDTLDSFIRTFYEVLDAANQNNIEVTHKLFKTEDGTENYVSLTNPAVPESSVDVFEYYWAHETQRKVSAGRVVDWLIETSEGARKFYDENMSRLVRQYESSAFDGNKRFKKYWYMRYAGPALRIGRLLFSLSSLHPVAKQVTKALASIPFLRSTLADYIGDIAIYTTTDKKDLSHEVRQNILGRSVAKVEALLESPEPEYNAIILAGHSLGSVVAYDTLNRITHRMNVGHVNPIFKDKLTGLVTFGSPLDKVAFFFRQRAKDDQIVKRNILNQHHAFKHKDWDYDLQTKFPIVINGIEPYLNDMKWLNFWHPNDPISGHLDFYDMGEKGEGNLKSEFRAELKNAHFGYWKDNAMYETIAQTFFAVPSPP